MSSITADDIVAPSAGPAGGDIGPLEKKHRQNANFRAVADGADVSKTHWHIATANALGWGFDGMDGVIFALVSPMVIKEFSLSVLRTQGPIPRDISVKAKWPSPFAKRRPVVMDPAFAGMTCRERPFHL